jgi:hypothetical protein
MSDAANAKRMGVVDEGQRRRHRSAISSQVALKMRRALGVEVLKKETELNYSEGGQQGHKKQTVIIYMLCTITMPRHGRSTTERRPMPGVKKAKPNSKSKRVSCYTLLIGSTPSSIPPAQSGP